MHRAIQLAAYNESASSHAQKAILIHKAISEHSEKNLSLKEIEDIIVLHEDEMSARMCGLSLPSKIVNKLKSE